MGSDSSLEGACKAWPGTSSARVSQIAQLVERVKGCASTPCGRFTGCSPGECGLATRGIGADDVFLFVVDVQQVGARHSEASCESPEPCGMGFATTDLHGGQKVFAE